MSQIAQKKTKAKSIMHSAAFMKGYWEARRGFPYDYEVFTGFNETKKRWDYERGRQFALIYNGDVKSGNAVTYGAQYAMHSAINQFWIR